MTIEEIKDFLPKVKVRLNGKTFEATTSGRENGFCAVTVFKPFPGIPFQSWEFSWEAIARSINEKTSLSI